MKIMQLGQIEPGFSNRSLVPVVSGWMLVTTVVRDYDVTHVVLFVRTLNS